MKKLFVALAAAMVLAMGCLMVGCSEESPSDVTKTYLDALKSQDSDAFSKASTDGSANPLSQGSLMSVDTSKMTEKQKKVMDEMTEKMLDFDYAIGDEAINDDKATVKVKLTTYKIGDALSSAIEDYIPKAMAQALSGKTDEDAMTDLLMDCFSDQLSSLKDKGYEKTITFNLTKGDDGWTIDTLTEDQIDALSGGVVEAGKKLSSTGASSK